MPIEAIAYPMLIYTILPIILESPCFLIAIRILLRPEIYRRYQFLIFFWILAKLQLIIFMHMSRPGDMKRTNLATYQRPIFYFLHTLRNPICALHIGPFQQPLPVC